MSVAPPQTTSGLFLGRSASHQRTQCAAMAGSHSPGPGLLIPAGSACSRPPAWGEVVGCFGIRCPGLESQPHHILSVLRQARL